MADKVLAAFLERQAREGMALAGESDLVSLLPLEADRFLAEFRCRGLVQAGSGAIETCGRFLVGIWFPPTYLRIADPFHVLTWLGPRNVWHPNISNEAPFICVGRLAAGTGLVDILYQVFEVITWNKVTMREDDALNRAACQWARQNGHRFPVDDRPLKRQPLLAQVVDRSARQ